MKMDLLAYTCSRLAFSILILLATFSVENPGKFVFVVVVVVVEIRSAILLLLFVDYGIKQ